MSYKYKRRSNSDVLIYEEFLNHLKVKKSMKPIIRIMSPEYRKQHLFAKQRTSYFLDKQNANKIWKENKRIFKRLQKIDENTNHSVNGTVRSNHKSTSNITNKSFASKKFKSNERRHENSPDLVQFHNILENGNRCI